MRRPGLYSEIGIRDDHRKTYNTVKEMDADAMFPCLRIKPVDRQNEQWANQAWRKKNMYSSIGAAIQHYLPKWTVESQWPRVFKIMINNLLAIKGNKVYGRGGEMKESGTKKEKKIAWTISIEKKRLTPAPIFVLTQWKSSTTSPPLPQLCKTQWFANHWRN